MMPDVIDMPTPPEVPTPPGQQQAVVVPADDVVKMVRQADKTPIIMAWILTSVLLTVFVIAVGLMFWHVISSMGISYSFAAVVIGITLALCYPMSLIRR